MQPTFIVIAINLIHLTAGQQNIIENAFFQDFAEWKDVCNKTYESELEEMRAFKNFYKNKKDIDKHNVLFDDGLVSFQRHLWDRSDLSIKEKRRYLNGFILEDVVMKKRRKRGIGRISEGLAPQSPRLQREGEELVYPKGPASIDWRDYGMITPVQDQGYTCASCWTFSSLGPLEAAIYKKTGVLPLLSEQNLLDCNKHKGSGNWGCDGGYMIGAYEYIIKNRGINAAASYPMEDAQSRCRYNSTISKARVKSYVIVPPGNETLLRDVVAAVGPVSIGMHGSLNTFYSYSNGVYYDPNCSSTKLDHAVMLIGYGTDDEFGDYWIARNSWGIMWGESGFFRVARNRDNHCGFASYIVYPIV